MRRRNNVATLFDETVDNTCTRHSTGERLSCWKRCNVGRLLAPEGLVIERERERKRERERERERDLYSVQSEGLLSLLH
jgi:hypothetical protein